MKEEMKKKIEIKGGDMVRHLSTKTIITLLLVTLLLVLFGFILRDMYSFGVDDSYIFYRYAENIATGKGFVFNVGEPAGEGFTSWMWTLMLATGHWLGFNIIQVSKILGILFHILGAGLVFLLVRFLLRKNNSYSKKNASYSDYNYDSIANVIGGLLAGVFLFNYPMIAHSVSGMETSLYVFTLLLLTYFTTQGLLAEHTQYKWWWILALTSTCAFWVRPEGIAMGGIALLAMAVVHWKALLKPRVWLYLFGGLVLPLVLFILMKVQVFGYPLPHSYYHKLIVIRTEYNDSLRHLLQFLHYYRWLIAISLISTVYAILKQKKYLYLYYPLFFIAMSGVYLFFYPAMNYLYRFYIPYLPLLLVMMVPAFALLAKAMGRPQYRFYRPFVLLVVFILLVVRINVPMTHTLKVVNGWRTMVDPEISRGLLGHIMAELPSNIVVANSEMGVIPYYSGLTCIDMAGLTDPYIAHAGLTMKYLEKRKVELILFPKDVAKVTSSQWNAYTLNYKDVFLSPLFKESFQCIGSYPASDIGAPQYFFYADKKSPHFDTMQQWLQSHMTTAPRPQLKP